MKTITIITPQGMNCLIKFIPNNGQVNILWTPQNWMVSNYNPWPGEADIGTSLAAASPGPDRRDRSLEGFVGSATAGAGPTDPSSCQAMRSKSWFLLDFWWFWWFFLRKTWWLWGKRREHDLLTRGFSLRYGIFLRKHKPWWTARFGR